MSGSRCCSISARRPRRSRSTRCRPTCRFATAMASPRRRSAPASPPEIAARRPSWMRRAPARAADPARGWSRSWSRGSAAATSTDDPSIHYYVPTIPLQKPDLVRAIREQKLKSVSAVFKALGGGVEDAASKPALASLLITIWSKEYEDERDARFINDRVHANIQKDGTFSVIPEMPGGVCTPDELRRIADVAVKYEVPLVKVTGGQRIDLVGVAEGSASARLAGARHAGGIRLGQELSHLQELHRHRLLPVWPRRQHGAGAEDRTAFSRHRQPGQAQARHRRLSAQLLGGADQGRRRRRDRRWQVGNLYRRRRRLARAQGRPAVRRGQRRRCAALFRPLHAVLPREREVQGADLHLRRTAWHRAHSRRRDRRQRRAGRGPRCGDAGGGRGGLRSLARSHCTEDRQSVRIRPFPPGTTS